MDNLIPGFSERWRTLIEIVVPCIGQAKEPQLASSIFCFPLKAELVIRRGAPPPFLRGNHNLSPGSILVDDELWLGSRPLGTTRSILVRSRSETETRRVFAIHLA